MYHRIIQKTCHITYAWAYLHPCCRHHMNTFSMLLALFAGNSPVTGEFPSQRPVTRSFDVFFDLRQNKRLSKQSKRRWFETSSRPLWRHCNDLLMRRNTAVFCLDDEILKHLNLQWLARLLFDSLLHRSFERRGASLSELQQHCGLLSDDPLIRWSVEHDFIVPVRLKNTVLIYCDHWPLLLTWFNFIPSRHK